MEQVVHFVVFPYSRLTGKATSVSGRAGVGEECGTSTWVSYLRSVPLSGRGKTLACVFFLRPMMWEPVYRCDRHQAWAKSLGLSGGLDRMGPRGPKVVGEGNLSLYM